MDLSNITWNGNKNSVGQAIAQNAKQLAAGQSVTVAGTSAPVNYTYQITINGAGIFPTPILLPKSQDEINQENADAFDHAMGIVG